MRVFYRLVMYTRLLYAAVAMRCLEHVRGSSMPPESASVGYPTAKDGKHHLLLEAYGYRWYRVGGLDYLPKRSEIESRAGLSGDRPFA